MTERQLEQLNVKIAKKLGWKSFRKERLPYPLHKEKRTTGISPGNFRHQFVPSYTNNLAYAMKCVDWATAHNYNFNLIKYGEYVGEFDYLVTFECNEKRFTDMATLPSMAVCLAFLKLK